MSYQVLERDEHGYATHTTDNGTESWYQNYYNEEGKWIDLTSIHFRILKGHRSEWFNKIYENEVNLYTKYNEKRKAIAYYRTDINGLYLNWLNSHWHCKLNKIEGLSYQEYKEWLKEIGVRTDESSTN